MNTPFGHLLKSLDNWDLVRVYGKVVQVVGLLIESAGPPCAVGDICRIINQQDSQSHFAEVVGFREGRVLSMPLGDIQGISPGSDIVATGEKFSISVSDGLLGRVLDGLGNVYDGRGPIEGGVRTAVHQMPPHPLHRRRIAEPFSTGVRAIDGLLTLGYGQRVGIFAGSGVGKSTLLGMIARNASADVNVIALVGERGREVRDFMEKELGKEGLKRSVVVVATSDQPALVRIKSALVATTIAEHFREKGKSVLLMMDSLTRVAMALREVGLTIGEPPTTRGYTPSVFAFFPRMLERAGTSAKGSITGLYTVLVEGDDMNEPVADAARGILDGHIVLSRKLASSGHFPAIDVLESISRVATDVITGHHRDLQSIFLDRLAAYREAEDLINIGAYVKGSNPRIDDSIERIEAMRAYLRQIMTESSSLQASVAQLGDMFK